MTIDAPRNARSRRTVAALLAATRELIEQQGFEAVSMATVAERAGVSRRAVYLHFSTRTDLVLAVYRSLGDTEDLAESRARVWQCEDAAAGLDEWARHIARSHPRILAVLRAIERASGADDDAAELWRTTMGHWRTTCRRLAAWLHDDGRLAEPWTVATAADMLWSLMSLDLLERLIIDRRWSARRFADHYAALLAATFLRT